MSIPPSVACRYARAYVICVGANGIKGAGLVLSISAALWERRDLAMAPFFLLWVSAALFVSSEGGTPPLPVFPAAELVYSYTSSARISREMRANLSAEVRKSFCHAHVRMLMLPSNNMCGNGVVKSLGLPNFQ